MPLTTRERQAVWFARQHYLKELLHLLDDSLGNETPAAFVTAFRFSLEIIRDRIAAEDPATFDLQEPAPCPAFPTISLPGLPNSSLLETLGPEKLEPLPPS